MTKDELIEQLQQIPGNPVVLVKVGSDWLDALYVGGTGQHRNGIAVYPFDENMIDYLGPVP